MSRRESGGLLAGIALLLLGLAMVPGNPASTQAATAAGVFGAVAYVLWRGPRH